MEDEERVSAWLKVLERKIDQAGNGLLKGSGITVMQLRVLKYLKAHPDEAQIADLSEFFGVTHTSMVHVVNALEEKGLVYREPIRRSRGKKIILTDGGRALADENEGRIDRVEEALTEGFSDAEKDQLLAMLARIDGNLERSFGK